VKLPGGKKALIVGIPLGLAVAGGLAFTQLSGASAGPPPVPDPKAGQHGVMLALDERVINLATGGQYRYAKVGLTVELRPASAGFYDLTGKGRADEEKTETANYEASVPVLLDTLGTVVASEDAASLTTADGRKHLKDDLLAAVRGVVGEKEVLDIYFTDFVMQ
jgi:flagellar basal body-associated protein FliL